MSQKTELDRLGDMIAAAERAARHLGGRSLAELLSDELRQDGIVRALEVVGEACKHIDPATRERCPAVPWQLIARMRDRLIHGYDSVDWQIVWDTVTRFVPQALIELRRLHTDLSASAPPAEGPSA